jgi:hypothetical protein
MEFDSTILRLMGKYIVSSKGTENFKKSDWLWEDIYKVK